MRKEELLFKKSKAVKNIQWYVKNVLTDEDLKTFSALCPLSFARSTSSDIDCAPSSIDVTP